MNLDEKIGFAEQLVSGCVKTHQNPVIMSSFGKDSMVLLEIIKRLELKLPILFHREPFFPKKYEFANKIITENEYVVYDYPPLSTAVMEKNGFVEILNFHQVGKQVACLPTGIVIPNEGEEFLCGFMDLYNKPKGTFIFPWDVAFVAHKSSDIDPIHGAVPLRVSIKYNPRSCDYAFPLRWFTDADIWECHKRFDIPVNLKRYDPEKQYAEREDKSYNNDWFPACTLCLRKSSPVLVRCPKFAIDIPNLSSTFRRADDIELPDYFQAKNLSE